MGSEQTLALLATAREALIDGHGVEFVCCGGRLVGVQVTLFPVTASADGDHQGGDRGNDREHFATV